MRSRRGGEDSTTTEEQLDDWHDVDLVTEAVVVFAPDGQIAGYADVVNRAHVVLTAGPFEARSRRPG